jgi:hypothetical protein
MRARNNPFRKPGDTVVVTVGFFSRKNIIPPLDGFYAY